VAEFMHESIVFVLRVRCRRKESLRSLSHLLMSFLSHRLLQHRTFIPDLLPHHAGEHYGQGGREFPENSHVLNFRRKFPGISESAGNYGEFIEILFCLNFCR